MNVCQESNNRVNALLSIQLNLLAKIDAPSPSNLGVKYQFLAFSAHIALGHPCLELPGFQDA